MKANEMLSKIKSVLSTSDEVKLEQVKLENGTVLEAEKFEAGNEVFILTADEKVALPVGEYQLESGQTLVIKEEGVIANLGDTSEEEEEEMRDDGKEAAVDDWAGMEKRIKNLEDAIADLKERVDGKQGKEEKVEEVTKEDREDMSAIPQEVQDALKQPATKPLNHNPSSETKRKQFLYGQNRPQNTMDRVLEMINNIN